MAPEYGWRAKKYQEGRLLIRKGKIVQGADSDITTNREKEEVTAAASVFGIFELLENIAEFMDARDTLVLRRVNQSFNTVLRQPKFDGRVSVQSLAVLPVGKGPRGDRFLPRLPKFFNFLRVKNFEINASGDIFWSMDAELDAKFPQWGVHLYGAASLDLSKKIHVHMGPSGAKRWICAMSLTHGTRQYVRLDFDDEELRGEDCTISLVNLAEIASTEILDEFERPLEQYAFLLHLESSPVQENAPPLAVEEGDENSSLDSDTDEEEEVSATSSDTEGDFE